MGRVFTAVLLLLELVGGLGEAQAVQGVLQALLAQALGVDLAAEADDGGGLASAARLEHLQALLCQGGAALLGLALLVLAPQQQGQGAQQGEAVEGLAQGGHARYQPAAFMSAVLRRLISPWTTRHFTPGTATCRASLRARMSW
ncbi:hypothetical protein D3C78_1510530 [compost metagenome]